ncbi:MAG: flagellar hook-basal body complex protein FliE [Alcanivorax sp.]|jgi:flagellar hook-basal body complex protein FliE
MEINQVLSQMKAMASAASQKPNLEGGADAASKVDFGTLMRETINDVNESQRQAKELRNAFESGDSSIELPEVMVALQKASVSFQAVTQVRNKLLSAYQEVMKMQV